MQRLHELLMMLRQLHPPTHISLHSTQPSPTHTRTWLRILRFCDCVNRTARRVAAGQRMRAAERLRSTSITGSSKRCGSPGSGRKRRDGVAVCLLAVVVLAVVVDDDVALVVGCLRLTLGARWLSRSRIGALVLSYHESSTSSFCFKQLRKKTNIEQSYDVEYHWLAILLASLDDEIDYTNRIKQRNIVFKKIRMYFGGVCGADVVVLSATSLSSSSESKSARAASSSDRFLKKKHKILLKLKVTLSIQTWQHVVAAFVCHAIVSKCALVSICFLPFVRSTQQLHDFYWNVKLEFVNTYQYRPPLNQHA